MRTQQLEHNIIKFLGRFKNEVELACRHNLNNAAVLGERVIMKLLNIAYEIELYQPTDVRNPGFDLIEPFKLLVIQIKANAANNSIKEIEKKLNAMKGLQEYKKVLFSIADMPTTKKVTANAMEIQSLKTFQDWVLNQNDEKKEQIVTILEKEFADNIYSSKKYYYTYKQVMINSSIDLNEFGFPCEQDFEKNMVYEKFKIISNAIEELKKNNTLMLYADAGRGKSVLSKIIARYFYKELNHDVIFFDFLNYSPPKNNALFERELFNKFHGENILFIIDNIHIGNEYEKFKTLSKAFVGTNPGWKFLFLGRRTTNIISDKLAVQIRYTNNEVSAFVESAIVTKKLSKAIRLFIGDTNPNFKLFAICKNALNNLPLTKTFSLTDVCDNYAKEFCYIDLLTVSKALFLETVEEIAAKSVQSNEAIAVTLDNANDNLIATFEKIAKLGLLHEVKNRSFSFWHIIDAKAFYYSTDSGKKHFEDYCNALFDDVINFNKIDICIDILTTVVSPEGSTFYRPFFEMFHTWCKSNFESSLILFAKDLHFLNYYYLNLNKIITDYNEEITNHFKKVITHNSSLITNAAFVDLQMLAILGNLLFKKYHYFFDANLLVLNPQDEKNFYIKIKGANSNSFGKLRKVLKMRNTQLYLNVFGQTEIQKPRNIIQPQDPIKQENFINDKTIKQLFKAYKGNSNSLRMKLQFEQLKGKQFAHISVANLGRLVHLLIKIQIDKKVERDLKNQLLQFLSNNRQEIKTKGSEIEILELVKNFAFFDSKSNIDFLKN